jgi:hypothetical protein
MSKKSRKIKTKGKAVQSVASTNASNLPASAIGKRVAPVAAAVAFQPKNYDYVKSDLVRIGVVASVLILILIILTFVPALKS